MSKLTPREILTAGAVVPVMAIDDLSTAGNQGDAAVVAVIRILVLKRQLREPDG